MIRILLMTIAFAHLPGGGFPPPEIPEEPTAYVVEMPKEEPTEAPTEQEAELEEPETKFYPRLYRVNGVVMPEAWQHFLYDQLEARGIAWFFAWAQAQIYGESRFNAYAANPNGLDKGLCQFREPYWAGWAAAAGVPGASIWDPYAQIVVYAWMMSGYLAGAGCNVGGALSAYFLGTAGWSDFYVDYISGLYYTIEVVW